jgi:lysophospholipase L1-like esterase
MHLSILVSIFLSFGSFYQFQDQHVDTLRETADSISCWKGFTRYHYEIEGRKAFITAPGTCSDRKDWVWRARFPEWHTEMDEILLDHGIYIAYIDTDHMFGSPRAMEIWDLFYSHMVDELGFAPRVTLEGVSRGGLFVFNWAKKHPWKIHSIYTEAPVCDFKSWPGGWGTGMGDSLAWSTLKEAYGFKDDRQALSYPDNPVDQLETLARAKVPILSMIGLNDQVVPPSENIFILSDRYVRAGGSSTLIPCTRGEETLFGHHFSIETPAIGAEFILANMKRPRLPLRSRSYHRHGSGLENSRIKFERSREGTVAFLGGSITQNGGWRDSVCAYLNERFPDTRFRFIPAGIASMGTTPGAFRLERDVLSKGPVDLLFVEAAVNDATNGRSSKEQIRGMEGIVRHTLSRNPRTDIVVMHFADPEKIRMYNRGETPGVIGNFNRIAAHYNIGTINLAREVTERINNREFTWEEDFIDLHPSPFGQGVYFRSIKVFMDHYYAPSVRDPGEISEHAVPEPYDPYCYDGGKMIPIGEAVQLEGFRVIRQWTPPLEAGTRQGYTRVDMLVGKEAGDSFMLHFEGKAIGMMVAAGPDAGMIEYSIDGSEAQVLDFYTAWSGSLYLPWYYTLAAELEPGPHTLQVCISKKRNENSLGNSCILKSFYVNE